MDEVGPEYGLFKHETKGQFYSPIFHDEHLQGWRPSRELTHTYKYKVAEAGFDAQNALLGAPLSTSATVEEEMVLERIKELVAPARHLRRLQDAQLEFVDDGHSPHVAIKVYTAYMLVRRCNAPLADCWRQAPCILIHRRFLRRASTRASLRSRFCPTAQRSARSQMPGTRCSCTSP